ncbi:hypothetical protein Fmac_024292 [Flemingia macrophylla]|uniref:Uncharacterized protein n=1 Tax=Flemingia macrophylla TaxID=520843 RepID=A0ABD1LNZ1_9FABA
MASESNDSNNSSSSSSSSSSSVIINIYECEYRHAVCVSRVPRSLRCGNPQAFSPQFVGLGPYHGFSDDNFTVTNKLKLEAAQRALHPRFVGDYFFWKQLKNCVSDFYHADINSQYGCDMLREGLTVDGLFLMGLLHSDASAHPQDRTFFLTGKPGMPLVNEAGVELTMDAVIRDVFMLENQIPTHVLLQINHLITNSNSHEIHSQDLGAKMLTFCQNHSPLVNFQELPAGKPEDRDHLLNLMYHLSAPKPPEPKKSKSDTEKANSDTEKAKSEADKSNSETQKGQATSPDSNGNTVPTRSLMGSIVWYIFMFFVILAVILGFSVYLICILFKWLLSILGKLLSGIFGLLKKLPKALSEAGRLFNVMAQDKKFKPFAQNFEQLSSAIKDINMDNDARPAVTIPSVTELNGAGIHFEPAKGISDIKYNVATRRFSLPVIKLDATSEVIIRNLVAYEALTRPTYLIFGRYVEIMRAIIDTPEDVKLLVNSKIIETELSDKVVANLFNKMSKSIRATNTPDLEEEIKKVNAKFDESQWLQRVMIKYVYRSWKLMTVVAAFVFLVLTAVQTYCSIYNCSSRRSSTLAGDWDYYAINNHFITLSFSFHPNGPFPTFTPQLNFHLRASPPLPLLPRPPFLSSFSPSPTRGYALPFFPFFFFLLFLFPHPLHPLHPPHRAAPPPLASLTHPHRAAPPPPLHPNPPLASHPHLHPHPPSLVSPTTSRLPPSQPLHLPHPPSRPTPPPSPPTCDSTGPDPAPPLSIGLSKLAPPPRLARVAPLSSFLPSASGLIDYGPSVGCGPSVGEECIIFCSVGIL